MSVKSAIRKLTRAFTAKDAAQFDDGISELEEEMEKSNDEEKDPDTIEVHNHIPDSMMDTARGVLPEKDPPGFDHAHDGEEAPPWFKKHEEATDKRFKAMTDSIENLRKGDRRPRDEEPEEEFGDDPDTNLEMADRGRGRDEEDPEREEERSEDRRGRDRRDEANKEILGELEFEAPPGTGDRARRAKDSKFFEESFQDAVSKAEVLSPGISVPTFDSKAAPIKTVGAILKLRKTALDLAYNKAETRGVIDQAMGGRTLDSKRVNHGQARVLFNAAASAIELGNNRRSTDHAPVGGVRRANDSAAPRIASVADINRINREKYATK